MRVGIFAKTFEGKTPLAVMQAAKDAGFSAVQYNMACSGLAALPEVIDAQVAQAVAEASKATGVAVSAVSATYNMIHPDAGARLAGRKAFGAIAAQARSMGTNLVTLCTGSADAQDQWRAHPYNDSPAGWRDMCGEFEQIIPVAEKHGIYLGVEPELANVLSSAVEAKALLDQMKSDRIKFVFDAANLFEVPSDQQRIIDSAVDAMAGHIALAHAKDKRSDGTFCAAGTGAIDFGHVFKALRRVGFDGEVVTHGLAASQATAAAKFLKDKIL